MKLPSPRAVCLSVTAVGSPSTYYTCCHRLLPASLLQGKSLIMYCSFASPTVSIKVHSRITTTASSTAPTCCLSSSPRRLVDCNFLLLLKPHCLFDRAALSLVRLKPFWWYCCRLIEFSMVWIPLIVAKPCEDHWTCLTRCQVLVQIDNQPSQTGSCCLSSPLTSLKNHLQKGIPIRHFDWRTMFGQSDWGYFHFPCLSCSSGRSHPCLAYSFWTISCYIPCQEVLTEYHCYLTLSFIGSLLD